MHDLTIGLLEWSTFGRSSAWCNWPKMSGWWNCRPLTHWPLFLLYHSPNPPRTTSSSSNYQANYRCTQRIWTNTKPNLLLTLLPIPQTMTKNQALRGGGETRVGKRKSAGDVGGQATSRKTALPICQKGMHPAAARSCRRGISTSFEQWIHGLYGSALRWYQLAPPQNVNPLDTPIGLDALYAFNARQPYSQPWTQSIKCHCPRYVLF